MVTRHRYIYYGRSVFVRLLGPVEVAGPRGRAVLSGRQRMLVGVLALQAGSVVVASRVVEALWGEDPPRTAIKSLHSHVARVRQALGACGLTEVVLTRGAGYTFAVDRGDGPAIPCRGRAVVADGPPGRPVARR